MNKFELFESVKFFAYRKGRKTWLKGDLQSKLSNSSSLDSEMQKRIARYWKSKIKNPSRYIDYRWFEVYNTTESNKTKLQYYIPDNFYYCYVDTFFSHPRDAKLLDDKNLYDLFFYDVRQPRTIVRSVDGILLDSSYKVLSIEQALELCKKEENVILKKTSWSEGGNGIFFWDSSLPEKMLSEHLLSDNFIVQEIVHQHADVAKIHSSSINTVRLMTLFFKGEVQVLSSVFRMGVNSAKVDNASSGGIVSGIQTDGRLKNYAYDTKGQKYLVHPQGMHFDEVVIPNYSECVDLVKQLAPRFVSVSKLISWDIAIAEDGHPILIEANLSFGEIDFHQMNNGPIFGEMTDEILDYVIINNKFIKK